MPANVTIEFEKARGKYQQANSPQAKLEALLEMQKTAPGHKGGENLRKDISRKIAAVKKDIEKKSAKEKKKGSAPSLSVRKEGIGQVAIVGMPNSGKSWLLRELTGVQVEIAPYPFTTRKPAVGMMDFKGGKVQLVEVPALVEGSSGGKANGLQLLSIARNADAIVVVARTREGEGIVRRELQGAKIFLNQKKPAIEVRQSEFKGIAIVHKKNLKVKEEELQRFLHGRGMYNASVILNEPLESMAKVERVLDSTIAYKNAVVVNPFGELDRGKLKERIFQMLGKVLVFTKKPGEKAVMDKPLALPVGSTVEDAARVLHKDFARLKYAKVWGSSKYSGQRVQKEYELKNMDVVEVYC